MFINKKKTKIITGIIIMMFVLICSIKLTTAQEIQSEEITTEDEIQPEEIPDYKILFVGNSSTYYNDMPGIVKGLAKADGTIVKVSSVTAANYTLSQFANDENDYHKKLLEVLSTEHWDYVVLQDHRDSIVSNTDTSKAAVQSLKELIDRHGAQIILYETQADYIGKNFKINGTTVYLNHAQIQYYLNRNYYAISNEFDTLIAAAGVNYTRCMKTYPEINLYTNDFIHPTVAGSYLTACTLYKAIFNKNAYNNQFLPESTLDTDNLLKGLTKEDAMKLQSVSDASLTFTNKSITTQKGMSGKVEAKLDVYSENLLTSSDYEKITYFSLDDKIVAIDQYSGDVTAVAPGRTMIMARTESGLMAFCNVNVIEPATAFVIEEKNITRVYKKDTFQFTATLYPADTTDTITWTSSNSSVVSVDENGVVKAKKLGVAKITAITDSGIKLTRKVYVRLKTPTKVKAKIKTKYKRKVSISVTWKKNTSAAEYYIYRSAKKGSGYKKIATITANRYIDKNKKRGKTYYYKVRAVYENTNCNSPLSTVAKITISGT